LAQTWPMDDDIWNIICAYSGWACLRLYEKL
jgi:hypothetical protein